VTAHPQQNSIATILTSLSLWWRNEVAMKNLNPVISIVAGILVLAFPNLLQWVVGISLIVMGVTGLMKK
jgi:uncharacterized membrane protein HdeD (DUF308 family)